MQYSGASGSFKNQNGHHSAIDSTPNQYIKSVQWPVVAENTFELYVHTSVYNGIYIDMQKCQPPHLSTSMSNAYTRNTHMTRLTDRITYCNTNLVLVRLGLAERFAICNTFITDRGRP